MRPPIPISNSSTRHGIIGFALIAVGLVVAGIGFYRVKAREVRQQVYETISAIGALKLGQVEQWRKERQGDIQRAARGPRLRTVVQALLQDPSLLGPRAEVMELLQVNRKGEVYKAAFLYALDGRLLEGTVSERESSNPATLRAVSEAQASPEPVFSDFFTPQGATTYIDIAAPVRDDHGQPMGVVILRSDARATLFPMVQAWPIPTQSAESALVLRSGDEASVPHKLRHEAEASPRWHEPLTATTFPAVKAVLGMRGLQVSRDYRGKTVLADLRALPGSPWFLVTKLDEDEALARLHQEALFISAIIAGYILLAGAAFAYHYRHRQAGIFKALLESERALRESNQRFRDLVDSTDGIVWEADALTLAFSSVSANAERLLGYPTGDWQQPGFWASHLHPEDRDHAVLYRRTCTDRMENHDFEYRFMAGDGRVAWLRDIVKIVVEHGKQRWLRGLLVDITTQKELEEHQRHLQIQLQHSQKMESLGLLAGGVAHDLNNSLAAILGLASLHVEDQPEHSPLRRAFETIVKACNRSAKLVKGLLSLNRRHLAEEGNIDLNLVVRDEVFLLERTTLSRVRVEMALAENLPLIRGDAGALSHVLMNLCVNSVDAMEPNGRLTLRTRWRDEHVEVEVEDTGSGMPPEVVDRALEPFYTTKPQGKGTGLGLSIVYSTIKAHGGEMEIHSVPAQGTRILLRFPALPTPEQPPEPAIAPSTLPLSAALHLLIVDDDELVLTSIQSVAEVLGHTTSLSNSGEGALAELEAGLLPDLVILDVNMPGLGGAGTLPMLRRLRPALPVLLSTGRVDQQVLDLVQAYPKVTLLAKPYSIREFQEHLRVAMEG